MIAPRSRVLWWVGIGVVPLAGFAGMGGEVAAFAAALAGLMVVLAALDAVLGLRVLDGVRVELPPVTRLSKDRPGVISVLLHNASKRARVLRVGLPFPREIVPELEDVTTRLPEGSALARLELRVTPSRRGNFPVERCHVEDTSPLGFWAVRAALPVRAELRVYPNLMDERRQVAALFLNRGRHGSHAIRQVGKGREFEKLREYVAGDSFEDIHWKATARRGRPVTKVFQVERTQEVYVVVDSSRLTARQMASVAVASPGETSGAARESSVLEKFLASALVLGLAAEQQGDLFGLVTFNDRVGRFVRARNGAAHFAACRDALYTLEPAAVTPDFEELCAFLRTRLRKRALLVFLTALDDPLLSESFLRSIELVARQHLVLVNMIQPEGVRPLFGNPTVADLDAVYGELGGHLQWARLRELGKELERKGVKFTTAPDARLTAQIVSQYLEVKRRQML